MLGYSEKYPRVLLTSAEVPLSIAMPEAVLGKDEEARTTLDGPSIVRRRGIIKRIIDRTPEQFHTPIVLMLSVIAGILVLGAKEYEALEWCRREGKKQSSSVFHDQQTIRV